MGREIDVNTFDAKHEVATGDRSCLPIVREFRPTKSFEDSIYAELSHFAAGSARLHS